MCRHTHACLVPHCPSLALTELTAVVAADANDWDSVCTLAQLILQVHLFSHRSRKSCVHLAMAGSGWTRACCGPCARFVIFYCIMWTPEVIIFFFVSQTAILLRLFRACALLGSLECVHGSVDKGLSLLEQAAAKVYDIVHLNFDQFDSNDAIGCLRCSSGTWAALLCQASKGTRWRRFK